MDTTALIAPIPHRDTTATSPHQQLEDLGEAIAELSAHIDAASYQLLRMIAEFDRRDGWGDGFRSCAHWLNYRLGWSLNTGRDKVRVARALEGLPLISAAMARGKLSYSKVRELTRIATPQNEEDLVTMALDGTASHVQRIVRSYRRCERDELDAAVRQREGRYLSLRHDDDGALIVEGRLPAEVGALLTRALEACQEELRQRRQDTSAEVSAEAGASAGASAEVRPAQAAERDTPCQRQADALGLLAERALGAAAAKGWAAPYQVTVHVDRAVLDRPEAPGRCHVEHGPALSAQTARRLTCDAPEVELVEDADGDPLRVGRKTRRVSTPLLRALQARDAVCQFPGCERTGRLTPHHVQHWADGGPTDKDNLVLLCSGCHWRVHEGGCDVRGRAPDALTFTTPAGVELLERLVPPPVPPDPVAALAGLNAAGGHDVDARSNQITWQGERVDLDWAVELLLDRRG